MAVGLTTVVVKRSFLPLGKISPTEVDNTSGILMSLGEEVMKGIMNGIQKGDVETRELGVKGVTETVIVDLREGMIVSGEMTVIGMAMNMIVIESEDIGTNLDLDQGVGLGIAQGLVHVLVIEDPQNGKVVSTWLLQFQRLPVLHYQAN